MKLIKVQTILGQHSLSALELPRNETVTHMNKTNKS